MEQNQSYFNQRMQLLGIKPEHNSIDLWAFDAKEGKDVLQPRPIFTETAKGIDILVYSLARKAIRIPKPGSNVKKDYTITRYEHPEQKPNGDVKKYNMPKGQPTLPFFPPALLRAYDAQEQIPVLYITEGYFKAFKACMHGIATVGVPSITCMKDRETGKLYGDVLKLIETCKVQRLVWLVDGDCRELTAKDITDGIDLYQRPRNFFNTVAQFADLTSGLDETCIRYFAHINTDNIEGKPKGLDDLLCALPDRLEDITDEAHSFDKIKEGWNTGEFFVKTNISYNIGKVRKYFHLDNVDNFYHFYAESRPEIKTVQFKFNGTLYKYNSEEGKSEIVIPKAAGNYIRVGDHYFEHIEVPDIKGNIQKIWDKRDKQTITDDHTKSIFKHIQKYNAFRPVPDHINYQQVIHNCFNSYYPFEHTAEEGDYSITLKFFQHIFGHQEITITNKDGKQRTVKSYELGLDYFTLLYKKPQQILPILCLVSSENNTGKSTFVKYLKHVFGYNSAIVSNEDLASGFNSHWANKLLIMCEETKIDKDIVVEKVKALSTGNKIMMNAKGRDQVEIDFFGKFIFCTNNEDNFLPITDNDVRYWVLKVPVIPDEVRINDMDDILAEELPAFLDFINKRPMATEKQFRHWFKPEYLRTKALENVIKNSQPQIMKILYNKLEHLFYACDEGVKSIFMPASDIADFLKRPNDIAYIRTQLQKAGYKASEPMRGTYPVLEYAANTELNGTGQVVRVGSRPFHGRAYEFKREVIAPGSGQLVEMPGSVNGAAVATDGWQAVPPGNETDNKNFDLF